MLDLSSIGELVVVCAEIVVVVVVVTIFDIDGDTSGGWLIVVVLGPLLELSPWVTGSELGELRTVGSAGVVELVVVG